MILLNILYLFDFIVFFKRKASVRWPFPRNGKLSAQAAMTLLELLA